MSTKSLREDSSRMVRQFITAAQPTLEFIEFINTRTVHMATYNVRSSFERGAGTFLYSMYRLGPFCTACTELVHHRWSNGNPFLLRRWRRRIMVCVSLHCKLFAERGPHQLMRDHLPHRIECTDEATIYERVDLNF